MRIHQNLSPRNQNNIQNSTQIQRFANGNHNSTMSMSRQNNQQNQASSNAFLMQMVNLYEKFPKDQFFVSARFPQINVVHQKNRDSLSPQNMIKNKQRNKKNLLSQRRSTQPSTMMMYSENYNNMIQSSYQTQCQRSPNSLRNNNNFSSRNMINSNYQNYANNGNCMMINSKFSDHNNGISNSKVGSFSQLLENKRSQRVNTNHTNNTYSSNSSNQYINPSLENFNNDYVNHHRHQQQKQQDQIKGFIKKKQKRVSQPTNDLNINNEQQIQNIQKKYMSHKKQPTIIQNLQNMHQYSFSNEKQSNYYDQYQNKQNSLNTQQKNKLKKEQSSIQQKDIHDFSLNSSFGQILGLKNKNQLEILQKDNYQITKQQKNQNFKNFNVKDLQLALDKILQQDKQSQFSSQNKLSNMFDQISLNKNSSFKIQSIEDFKKSLSLIIKDQNKRQQLLELAKNSQFIQRLSNKSIGERQSHQIKIQKQEQKFIQKKQILIKQKTSQKRLFSNHFNQHLKTYQQRRYDQNDNNNNQNLKQQLALNKRCSKTIKVIHQQEALYSDSGQISLKMSVQYEQQSKVHIQFSESQSQCSCGGFFDNLLMKNHNNNDNNNNKK